MDYSLFKYIGSFVCHQNPERTLMINGELLPLCARCTGIYSGFLAGIIYQIITRRKVNKLPSLGIITISAILILGLIIDGLGESIQLWELSNQGRLLMGLFCGGSISVILFPLFNYFLKKDSAHRIIESKYYMGLLVLIILIFFFHYTNFSFLFFLIMSSTGLLANYLALNMTFAGMVLGWKKREITFANTSLITGFVLVLFVVEVLVLREVKF